MRTLLRTECWKRFDSREIGIILLLPLVLLALQTQWIYSGLWHDPWIYLGHMLNFGGHMKAFADQYAASRVSAILPGAILYHLLPPQVANLILHFGLYYLATISLYFTSKKLNGSRAALITAIFFGTSYFILDALGSDYVDAYIIAYFLAAIALLTNTSRKKAFIFFQILVAGILAFGLFNSNITAGILLPYLLFLVCLKGEAASSWKAISYRIGIFSFGFLVALSAISLVGYFANGKMWIFGSQLSFASTTATITSPFYSPINYWINHAYWLLFPTIIVYLIPIALLQYKNTPKMLILSGVGIVNIVTYFYLAALLLGLILLQIIAKRPVIQSWFYASWILLPLSYVTMPNVFGETLEKLNKRAWIALLCACLIVSTLSVALRTDALRLVSFPAIFITATVVLGLVFAIGNPMPRNAGVILSFSAINLLAGSNFQMRFTYPPNSGEEIDRQQSFDSRRHESFVAITQCANLAKRIAPDSDVWFWFDIKEELGPVFNAAACTHWWGFRILNRDFPILNGPIDMRGDSIKTGTRIMILSGKMNNLQAESIAQLLSAGIQTVELEKKKIKSGNMQYDALTLLVTQTDTGKKNHISP